jgi:glycosyltransferase involved in cell wall biosynthesis
MRTLIIIPDKYSYGGTSRFLERLLLLHDRYGIETALLVPAHNINYSIDTLATQHGVKIFSAFNRNRENTLPLITPFFDLLFSWRAIKSWRPDLLVVSTGEPGRMSVALFFPVPLLYILHTVPETRFRFLPRFYLRMGSLLKNRIITVSKVAAETISITMGIPPSKISVVYNSCRPIHHKPKSDLPIVVTAGHLVSYKNPHGWLKVAQHAIQKMADVTFVWLGDGELLASMRETVKTLGLEDRILLPGFVSDPYTWYEKSQVYFQPSIRESHGIAVLEAMSHGLPCVVSNMGGLPESVIDNETGFVCSPGDITGFAGHILALLGDSALRGRMGCAGRLRAEKYFSETQQEQKIMALYDRLVKKMGK